MIRRYLGQRLGEKAMTTKGTRTRKRNGIVNHGTDVVMCY